MLGLNDGDMEGEILGLGDGDIDLETDELIEDTEEETEGLFAEGEVVILIEEETEGLIDLKGDGDIDGDKIEDTLLEVFELFEGEIILFPFTDFCASNIF